jgi:transposase
MFVPRQQYPRELKIAIMRELDSGKSTAEVARAYQVSPNRLMTWRGEWRAKGELAFPEHWARPQAKLDAERIPELERKIGQMTMEIDFLKKSLATFQGASAASYRQWSYRSGERCYFRRDQHLQQCGRVANASRDGNECF